jgi:alpha/beta superfamily hydrolase
MKEIPNPKRKVIIIVLLIINIIGITIAGLSYYSSQKTAEMEEVWIYPSDPMNWEEEDKSYRLFGKIYYPQSFDLTNPSGNYSAFLLFHGYGRSLNDVHELAIQLTLYNFICFSIDFHGFGQSEGTFPTNGLLFNESFADAMGAYRWLSNKSYVNDENIYAFGHSMGGGASLLLTLQSLTKAFVAWYPGSAYIYDGVALYNSTLPTNSTRGYIIQGTADECGRCSPSYTQKFVTNNPPVDLDWIEGGTHGTGVHHSLYMSKTIAWIETNLSPSQIPSSWELTFSGMYTYLWILGVPAVIDFLLILILMIRKLKRKHDAEECKEEDVSP